jgi:filamentous hemagglutinin family protein
MPLPKRKTPPFFVMKRIPRFPVAKIKSFRYRRVMSHHGSRALASRWRALFSWAALLAPLAPACGQTLPTGGAFAAAGQTLTITQASPRGIIDWQGFSIGPGRNVAFNNGNGATLNRVTGATPSSLAGGLTASGAVYLINPNGIVIGPGGKILTGGSFIAATRDVPDAAFMAGGALPFTGASAGTIVNQGLIVSSSGNVVLAGAGAANRGTIIAPNGTVALAAGNRVVLAAASGPPGLYVAPDASAAGDAGNTGAIRAAAVALAAAGGNVYALAGNPGGIIAATGIGKIGGQVWLTAPNGAVTIAGPIRAAATGAGGTIIADGRAVTLTATAALNAAAAGHAGGTILAGISAPNGAGEARRTAIAGGAALTTGPGGRIETSGLSLTLGDAAITAGPGGTWLLDPQDLTIGPPAAAAIDAALAAGSNVTEATTAAAGPGAGTITIAAPLTWSTAATLTLSAFADLDIAAPITIAGNGGLALTTGNGKGGASPATAALNFIDGGAISYTAGADANAAPLTINAASYQLIFNAGQLQAVGATGDYALATSLDLSGIAFTPLAQHGFAGMFNGLGNVIDNLAITDTADNDVGLFGAIGPAGSVEALGLVGGATIGGGGLFSAVGALAGFNAGILRDDYATGAVTAASPHAIGGLVGANAGLIAQSYATGAVTATGAGTGAVGGLVGAADPNGVLRDVYATGAVTGAPYSQDGGLAGLNFETTIVDAFATGAVTGGNTAGLVADDQAGSYLDAYYDSTTAGVTAGPGLGLPTASWFAQGPLAPGSQHGFIDNAAWRAGGPYPVLAALPYVTLAETGARTYGGQLAASVRAITGAGGGNAASELDLSGFRFLSATDAASAVGTYAIGGAGAVDPGTQIDYTGSLTINPAPLTITPASETITYGEAPALSGQFSAAGLVNGDRVTGLAFATTAGPFSPVGSYAITASAATGDGLSNYSITYAPGALIVRPAPLIIMATPQSKQAADALDLGDTGFTVTGLRGGDHVSVVILNSAGAAASARPGAPYLIIPSAAAGNGLSNYRITYIPGTLTITGLAAPPGGAGVLPDGNAVPSALLLAAGPSGNGPVALPQFISAADQAGLAAGPSGLALSTGLPLPGQADTLPLLTGRARHLQLRLPPVMARAALGGF